MNELEERIRRVALRRTWANQKFGKCKGKGEGCEKGITREDLRPLQVTWYIPGLGRTTSLDIFCGISAGAKKTEKIPQKQNSRIKCRHCGGCHLTAKCRSRSGVADHLTTPTKQHVPEPTPVQSYYLGPPPGIESNPLDFECESEEHQLEPEEISATVQSYAQGNQPVEEVTALLHKILHHNHTHRANAHKRQYQMSRKKPHVSTNRKWHSSRRGVEDYNKDHRLDFRKRKTPPPVQPPAVLR